MQMEMGILHLLKIFSYLFPLVGLKRNASLLEICLVFPGA